MLLIDRRDGSKELAPYVHVPYEITTLPYADVSFLGYGPSDTIATIGVERKRVMDFLNSMTTGRLSGHQLIGLTSHYTHVYLVLEGLWRPRKEDGILERFVRGRWNPAQLGQRRFMAKEVTGFLNTLTVVCGVTVYQTASIGETGWWITDLYRWWQKAYGKHSSHLQFHVAPSPGVQLRKPALVHRVAIQFEGVGWDKGKNIARFFPTVRSLVGATEKQLKEVPGIGKKLAKSIREEINGQS